MSEQHTPTFQYVRNAYIAHRHSLAAEQGEFPPGIVERMNEFDRWYAAEFGRIIADAEQRGAAKALRDAASSGLFVGPIADLLENRAAQMEGDDD